MSETQEFVAKLVRNSVSFPLAVWSKVYVSRQNASQDWPSWLGSGRKFGSAFQRAARTPPPLNWPSQSPGTNQDPDRTGCLQVPAHAAEFPPTISAGHDA